MVLHSDNPAMLALEQLIWCPIFLSRGQKDFTLKLNLLSTSYASETVMTLHSINYLRLTPLLSTLKAELISAKSWRLPWKYMSLNLTSRMSQTLQSATSTPYSFKHWSTSHRQSWQESLIWSSREESMLRGSSRHLALISSSLRRHYWLQWTTTYCSSLHPNSTCQISDRRYKDGWKISMPTWPLTKL